MEQGIGNTPIIELLRLENGAKILAKLENKNFGGSIKDRVGQAIIDDAEERGFLKKGGIVVEATSGNTGIGLALVASARGYKALIVMPDTMSVERRKMIADYGGEVILTEGKKGMQGAVEKANEIVKNTKNCVLADQFNNPVCQRVHYEKTAPELWAQANEKIDIFVAGVGTGGTLTGIGRFLKEKNPDCKVVAVEPASSPLLSQGRAGAHGLQGIGANFVPSVLDRNIYDEVFTVSDEDGIETAKKLKREYGHFVGITSGANAFACMEIGKRKENAGKVIATVFPDDGNRYLSVFEL